MVKQNCRDSEFIIYFSIFKNTSYLKHYVKNLDKLSFQKKAFCNGYTRIRQINCVVLVVLLPLSLFFCNKSLNVKVYNKIRDMPMLSRDKKCFRKEDSASNAVLLK